MFKLRFGNINKVAQPIQAKRIYPVDDKDVDPKAPVVVLLNTPPTNYVNDCLRKYTVFQSWDQPAKDAVFVDNKNYRPFILLAKDIYQQNGKVRTLLDRFKDCPPFSFTDFQTRSSVPGFDPFKTMEDSAPLKTGKQTDIWVKEGIKPKDKRDLERIIQVSLNELGDNADLNFIDVSSMDSLSYLFRNTGFNGDVSKWDTSKVTNMRELFNGSQFNGDLSKWNTSKVTDMHSMFQNTPYNKSLDNFDTSKVTDMGEMFSHCKFNQPLKFDTSKVTNMGGMFEYSSYNHSLDSFEVDELKNAASMFEGSKFDKDLSKWNLPKRCETSLMFLDSPLEGKYGINGESLKSKKASKKTSSLRNIVITFEYVPEEYREDVKALVKSFMYDLDWDCTVKEVMRGDKPYGINLYIATPEQMDNIASDKRADFILVSIAYDPSVTNRYRISQAKNGESVSSRSFKDLGALERELNRLTFNQK